MTFRSARLAFSFFITGLSIAGMATSPLAAEKWHHGASLVGELQYGPDFTHFKWANPDAPKGGNVNLHAIGTFDSLNPFSFKGNPASRINLIYDSLMSDSPDEASTEYGLIAEKLSYPDDYSSVTFKLRPAARFHDGTPITPEDVMFSLEQITAANPQWAAYYRNVTGSKRTGDHEVTFYFDVKGNRELPHIVGQLTVVPKHFWTSKTPDGKPRDLAKTTLEVPLGSGPYRIKSFAAGNKIIYERVPDYWARDLPVSRGQWNFDTIKVQYFTDTFVAFESFKKGEIDYYQDNSSKNWATQYDFPALAKGWVKRDEVELKNPAPMQAFVLNSRREKLSDPRVRRAFNLAFDFEWTNKNLFYSQYRRISSYFANTELAAQGLPSGRELEILTEIKGDLPPEVFSKQYTNPNNNSPTEVRKNLRKASELLKAAGWVNRNRVQTHTRTGEQLTVEFLLVSPLFERIVLPYIRSLSRLGIKATARIVDQSQYIRRLETFDFDIVVGVFPQSESPGNEQRDFWGKAAAEKPGSRNLIGIKNKAIEYLIDKIIFAKDRSELIAATRALDRVLLWNHFVIPQWYSPSTRIAYWNKFARPVPPPARSVAFERAWWFDKARADELAKARN